MKSYIIKLKLLLKFKLRMKKKMLTTPEIRKIFETFQNDLKIIKKLCEKVESHMVEDLSSHVIVISENYKKLEDTIPSSEEYEKAAKDLLTTLHAASHHYHKR